MKIADRPEAPGAGGAPSNAAQKKPRTRFSDVLEQEKQRTTDDAPARDGEDRETAETKKRSGREPLPADGPVAPGFAPPAPFSSPGEFAPVSAGQGIATVGLEALLKSLAHEVSVVAPPGGPTSVDIQFDSRTLEGLHVRVQKAGDSVEVGFSTSSGAVSRLLTANADRLAEALVRLGYVAPVVSVQQPKVATAASSGESGQSGRDGGSRGRQYKGRGQKGR